MMTTSPHLGLALVLTLCALFFGVVNAQELSISYCSTDNNAGSNSPMWSEFQSTGLCGDHCTGAFAFAVVQGYNCWCSNYVPAAQQDTINCNQGCPGISTEWCGSTDAGLYGYFQLPAGNPLGTSGSGSVQSTTSSSSVSTSTFNRDPSSSFFSSPFPGRSSSTPMVTAIFPAQSSASTSPSSSDGSSVSVSRPVPSEDPTQDSSVRASPTTSEAEASPTNDPTPTNPPSLITSIRTVTGEVQTIIVTPTSTPSTDASHGQITSKGNRLGAGAIAGIVIGVLGGLAGLAALAFFILLRRRRNRTDDKSPDGSFIAHRSAGSSNGHSVPSRHASQMSQAGLLNKVPKIFTSGIPEGEGPKSATSNPDRRSMPIDQRLNPWALYSSEEARISNVSLQDNQDYSRQLRIANPDS